MYARTSIYITIHLFSQHFGILHKLSCKIKEKVPDKHFFISEDLLPLERTFIYEKYTLQKSKVYFTFLHTMPFFYVIVLFHKKNKAGIFLIIMTLNLK